MRVKAPEALGSQAVVAVAVTNRLTLYLWLALGPMLFSPPLLAIVLPEDRADLLFHSYSGGGADISGPSLLVRKKFSENLSATLNHYVDNVSSASIDVVTSASASSESRNENSLSLDFLNEKTLMTLGYARSEENDFDAATFSLNISQDMFGDLTTVSIGYAQGDNTVRQNDNPGFSKDMASRSYRLSLSQVISKDFLMALAFDTITDQGYMPVNPRLIWTGSEYGATWTDQKSGRPQIYMTRFPNILFEEDS